MPENAEDALDVSEVYRNVGIFAGQPAARVELVKPNRRKCGCSRRRKFKRYGTPRPRSDGSGRISIWRG
jgi:hypothetical protein